MGRSQGRVLPLCLGIGGAHSRPCLGGARQSKSSLRSDGIGRRPALDAWGVHSMSLHGRTSVGRDDKTRSVTDRMVRLLYWRTCPRHQGQSWRKPGCGRCAIASSASSPVMHLKPCNVPGIDPAFSNLDAFVAVHRTKVFVGGATTLIHKRGSYSAQVTLHQHSSCVPASQGCPSTSAQGKHD